MIISSHFFLTTTTLKYQQLFWRANWVQILYGSKVMTQMNNMQKRKKHKNINQISFYIIE